MKTKTTPIAPSAKVSFVTTPPQTPTLTKPSPPPPVAKKSKSLTYDDILANMGLCVFNGKLQQLEQTANEQDAADTPAVEYPYINKKARNIPQRDYIYSRLNKSLPQPAAPPTPQQLRNRLIQQIVHNKAMVKQNQGKRQMMFY